MVVIKIGDAREGGCLVGETETLILDLCFVAGRNGVLPQNHKKSFAGTHIWEDET